MRRADRQETSVSIRQAVRLDSVESLIDRANTLWENPVELNHHGDEVAGDYGILSLRTSISG